MSTEENKRKKSSKSVPETWISGRDAVNLSKYLFEHNGCPFTEISGDFGKDALVELSFGAERTLSHSIIIQIKGGRSFQRSSGRYFIPVGSHGDYWRLSNVPMIGIVHDPKDNSLYWCNISQYLHQNPTAATIPLSKESALTGETLESELKPAVVSLETGPSGFSSAEERLLNTLRNVCEDSSNIQLNAVIDCLALSRRRPAVLIILRHLISRLHKEPLRLVLQMLAAATVVDEGSVYSDELNQVISFDLVWFTQDSRNQLERHLVWTVSEIKQLLLATDPEDWYPTEFAFVVWLLLSTEGNQEQAYHKLEIAAKEFLVGGDERSAGTALELALEQFVELGAGELARMVREFPAISNLSIYRELVAQLEEFGEISIFSD